MSDELVVLLTVSRLEAHHLADLVAQFAELLDETDAASDDPAVARLVPDAYRDDAEAARDFRDATEHDLLGRRSTDAQRVLHDLRAVGAGRPGSAAPSAADAAAPIDIALDPEGVRAWMRSLAAIRLVIASRLEIESEDDHDEDDPRFGVYDWLGYRLDGLIQAAEAG